MANTDNDAKFRISAAVVKQLGEELVSDELTAIMELVKNAYDADADWVKISINTTAPPTEVGLTFPDTKGHIVIEDNGHGMDFTDITTRWLFISVSHKRAMKEKGEVTKNKHRTPLGDKGLGRLSTQRLGHILELYSCIASENVMHHVAFDWRHFTETSGLETVATNYGEVAKSGKQHGTKLIITDLKNPDIWTADAGDKFRGQLSQLIFPFKESRPFNVFLTINEIDYDLDAISDKLRQLAISSYKINFDGQKLTLTGSIKLAKLQGNSEEKREIYRRIIQQDSGSNFFHYLIDKDNNKTYNVPDVIYSGEEGVFVTFKREFELEKDIKKEYLIDPDKKDPVIANPGPFLGEIDEFNISGTDEVDVAYNKLSEYKLLVKNQTGVRIFRDGFGIKPYGMDNDDWLQLRKSQTSGGSFYLLRPDNVIGFFSITAGENRHLTEKTDREGFIDSPYSKVFFNIVRLAIKNINDVLDKVRRSYDGFKGQHAKEKGGIQSFQDTKNRLIATAQQSAAIQNEVQYVEQELKITAAKVSASVQKIKEEPLFSSEEENKALQILEEVNRIMSSSTALFEKINNILRSAQRLEDDANYLEPKIEELERQLTQFMELAGLGMTAEAFTHELYNIIDRISAQTDQLLRQNKKEANAPVFVYAEHIKSAIRSMRLQLNHLAPSLRFNRETKQAVELSAFASELKSYYHARFDGKIELNFAVTADFSIQINKGKLTQILDNIILNAEYWLTQMLKADKNFKPSIDIEIKSPAIYIADNGYGINPDLENSIFQPFVTSKPLGEGRGLGLFLVQQNLDAVDSTIALLQRRNTHNRRYMFEINFQNILIK